MLEMNYTEQQLTAAVASEGLRPVLAGLESAAPERLLSLIQRCWDVNPQNRPSFDEIVMELDPILEHRKTVKEKENILGEPSIFPADQHINDATNLRTYQESINWLAQGENFSKITSSVADSGVEMWFDSSNDPLTYRPILSWGSFATCGRRETMEDTHFLMPNMFNEEDIHVFGIFDGHRGEPKHNLLPILRVYLVLNLRKNAILMSFRAANTLVIIKPIYYLIGSGITVEIIPKRNRHSFPFGIF